MAVLALFNWPVDLTSYIQAVSPGYRLAILLGVLLFSAFVVAYRLQIQLDHIEDAKPRVTLDGAYVHAHPNRDAPGGLIDIASVDFSIAAGGRSTESVVALITAVAQNSKVVVHEEYAPWADHENPRDPYRSPIRHRTTRFVAGGLRQTVQVAHKARDGHECDFWATRQRDPGRIECQEPEYAIRLRLSGGGIDPQRHEWWFRLQNPGAGRSLVFEQVATPPKSDSTRALPGFRTPAGACYSARGRHEWPTRLC